MSTIDNLFISPIGRILLDLDLNDLEQECLNQKEQDPNGRSISNIGGWQSDNIKDINNPLFETIEYWCNSFAANIGLNPVCLDHAWININGKYHCNRLHDHQGSVLSGVYYIKVPKNSGNINFHHPMKKVISRDWSDAVSNCTPVSSQTWFFEPKPNLLMIFPSWIDHEVEPNLSDEYRISISFNTKVKY